MPIRLRTTAAPAFATHKLRRHVRTLPTLPLPNPALPGSLTDGQARPLALIPTTKAYMQPTALSHVAGAAASRKPPIAIPGSPQLFPSHPDSPSPPSAPTLHPPTAGAAPICSLRERWSPIFSSRQAKLSPSPPLTCASRDARQHARQWRGPNGSIHGSTPANGAQVLVARGPLLREAAFVRERLGLSDSGRRRTRYAVYRRAKHHPRGTTIVHDVGGW